MKPEREKLAVTFLSASIVTVHAPMPEQSPDQLSNVKPAAAAWVTFTTVPIGWVPPPVTVPPAPGAAVAVSLNCEREKLAVTALLASMVTSHVPVPEQALDQLSNVKPAAATWVTFTTVPEG